MRRLMVSQASAWIFFGIGRNWGAVKSASRCCYPLEGEVDKHLQEGGRYTGTGSFFINGVRCCSNPDHGQETLSLFSSCTSCNHRQGIYADRVMLEVTMSVME